MVEFIYGCLCRQELCPTLIGILGIPKDDKDVVAYCSTSTLSPNSDSENVRGVLEHGRGSSSLSQDPVKFKSARQVIFAIGAELIRCFGRVEAMRPVLASLYHRILLFPPPSQRNEALKMVAEVCPPSQCIFFFFCLFFYLVALKTEEQPQGKIYKLCLQIWQPYVLSYFIYS